MTRHPLPQVLAPAAATAIVLLLAAGPASASQDAGDTIAPLTDRSSTSCALERVGSQYVRCDDLTGRGVSAPGWVTARSSGAQVTGAVTSVTSAVNRPASGALLKWRRHGI